MTRIKKERSTDYIPNHRLWQKMIGPGVVERIIKTKEAQKKSERRKR